jgi:hypothetical protein
MDHSIVTWRISQLLSFSKFEYVAYYHRLCSLGDLAPLPIHCDDPTVELPTGKNIAISFAGYV